MDVKTFLRFLII